MWGREELKALPLSGEYDEDDGARGWSNCATGCNRQLGMVRCTSNLPLCHYGALSCLQKKWHSKSKLHAASFTARRFTSADIILYADICSVHEYLSIWTRHLRLECFYSAVSPSFPYGASHTFWRNRNREEEKEEEGHVTGQIKRQV